MNHPPTRARLQRCICGLAYLYSEKNPDNPQDAQDKSSKKHPGAYFFGNIQKSFFYAIISFSHIFFP